MDDRNLGYDFDAIDNIRNNLESYRIQNNNGFPILKELIQNANDAEASFLFLKFFPGDKDADHELLQNPGIFVYNDGPFSEKNERAMRTIGGSDKKDDAEKVGKYGLGMKSIYHICDFFFYIVDGKRIEFLNPWYKQNNADYTHNEWSAISEKDKAIILENCPKSEKGLTILIPGKTDYSDREKNSKLHISTGNSVDMRFPFGTSKAELVKDLTLCISLLNECTPNNRRHLEKIVYEAGTFGTFALKNKENEIIYEDKNDGKSTARYSSYSETNFADETKANLLNLLDEKRLIGDKIVENENLRKCTLELVRTKCLDTLENSGILTVKFCVFLPLQEPSKLSINIHTNYDYTILIHAPYMIDHGRQGMFGYKSLTDKVSEQSIEEISYKESASKCWNQLLSQNIVFPHLPLLLAEAVNDKICTSDDMSKIVDGLIHLNSNDKNLLNEFTVSKYGFAKKYLHNEGKLSVSWSVFDISDGNRNKYVFIPEASDKEVIKLLFPDVGNRKDISFVVGISQERYILPYGYTPDFPTIESLIKKLPDKSLLRRSSVMVLREFLQSLRTVLSASENLCKILISRLKNMLLVSSLAELSAAKSELSELFETINSMTLQKYKIYSVDTTEIGTLKIQQGNWIKMWNLDSSFIFIPGFIRLQNNINQSFSKELILGSEDNRKESICQFLTENAFPGEVQSTILTSLLSTKDIRAYIKEIKKHFPTIRIFGVLNVGHLNKKEYKNSIELEQLLVERRLFESVGAAVRKDSKLFIYASLIPRHDIFVFASKNDVADFGIEEELASLILNGDDSKDILTSLHSQNFEKLDYDESFKPEFINETLRFSFEINQKDSEFYRFLLAGFKTVKSDVALNTFATECDSRWKKIYCHCMHPDTILIPQEYEDCVKFAKMNKQKLRVTFLNDKDCFEQLNIYSWNRNLYFINDDKELSSEDFLTSILEKMSAPEHETLFRKLSFQKEYQTGKTIKSIDENCYLNRGNIDFPHGFNTTRTLVQVDDNSKIREFQEKFMKDRILTPGKAVRIVLEEKDEKIDYSDWIMNMLENASQNEGRASFTEIRNSVWHKKWVPTKEGSFCALNEILSDDLFSQDSLESLCHASGSYPQNDLKIRFTPKLQKELISQEYQETLWNIAKRIKERKTLYLHLDSWEELKSIAMNLNSEKFIIFYIVNTLAGDCKINDKSIIFKYLYAKLDIHPDNIAFVEALTFLNTKENITQGIRNLFVHILKEMDLKKLNLSSIKYPTQAGTWAQAKDITVSQSQNIYPKSRLDAETFYALKDKIEEESRKLENIENSERGTLTKDSSEEEIKSFFNSWIQKTPSKKLIYLFLYLLNGNFRKLAEKSGCIGEIKSYLDSEGFYKNGTINYDVNIHTGSETKIEVRNLLGSYITVAQNLTESFSSQDCDIRILSSRITISMSIIPENAPDSNDYAKETTKKLLQVCYRKSELEIGRMLDYFSNTNQNTIGMARKDVEKGMKYILRSLNVKNDKFKEFERQYNEIYELETKKHFNTFNFQENESIADKKRDSIAKEFIRTLKTDTTLQNDVFKAVCLKIDANQYYEDSILFEFFQNADDCVNDLVNCGVKIEKQNRVFKIQASPKRIIVTHYGRMINYTPSNTNFKFKDKFKFDLINMVSLYSSNKEKDGTIGNQLGDTGKFGLGFKSVYKICREPVVRSGELEFKIVAGLYPVTVEHSQNFKNDSGETRFELEVTSGNSIENICGRFERSIPFLVIFSKQINSIYMNNTPYSLSRETIYAQKNRKMEYINVAGKEFLYIDSTCSIKYTILFKTNNKQVTNAARDEASKIWNLTPLESVANLPFFINTDFSLDTGRRNLSAHSDNNEQILRRISFDLAETLCITRKELTEKNFTTILNIMVLTYNMQSNQLFKEFSQNIINKIYEKTNTIPSGWGTLIKVKDTTKLFSLSTTRYNVESDNAENLLTPVQNFMSEINENYFALTESASNLIQDITNYKGNIRIEDLLSKVKDNKSPEILELYARIAENIKTKSLFRETSFNGFKLLNQKGEYIPCSQILIRPDAPEKKALSDKYSDNVRHLLKENILFEQNYSRDKENETVSIINQLRAIEVLSRTLTDKESEFDIINPDDLRNSVENVYNWWHNLGSEGQKKETEKYYTSLLPAEFHYEKFSFINRDENSSKTKGELNYEWFILFLLAVYQSLPGNHQDAKNKAFFSRLIDLGLNKKLSEKIPSENKESWIDMIVDFCKDRGQINGEEYFYWMSRIPSMIRLYEFKDSYIQIFKQLDRLAEKDIQSILSPETLAEASGTGLPYAPSLKNTLRIGASLVVRELLLKEVIRPTESTVRQAYMPKARVKEYLGLKDDAQTKITSSDIYNRLIELFDRNKRKATFDGYYDIPILIKLYNTAN